MNSSDESMRTNGRPAWLLPSIAATAVIIALLAWCLMPATADEETGPPRLDLTLNVAEGERLVSVKSGQGDQVAFILAQGLSRKIWFEGRITEAVDEVVSIHFYRRAERREMLAVVKRGTNTHVLASAGEGFPISPPLTSLSRRTELREKAMHFAWVANDKEGAHVLFFDGTSYRLGEPFTSISSLQATKDGLTVTVNGLIDRANAYGYDTHAFNVFEKLTELGENSFVIFGKKPSNKWFTVIDHTVSEAYEELRDWKYAEEQPRLVYLGKRKDGWRVMTESRVEGDEPRAEHGPFDWIGRKKGAPIMHDFNGNFDVFHFIAGRGDNQHVAVYGKGNKVLLSPAFSKLSFSGMKAAGLPLYEGIKEDSVSIVHGATAGPNFEAVEKLRLIEKAENFAYIGESEGRFKIAHGAKILTAVDRVAMINTTKPSENLIAVIIDGEDMKVYHQDKFSTASVAVLGLKARKDDGLAWKIDDGEGERVVRDHQRGPRYESIGRLAVSPGGKLWYDGQKEGRSYRVLEDQVGNPADALTDPIFTAEGDQMVYGHMRRAADDLDPDQFVERWKVIDEKGAGKAFIRTPSRANPDKAIRFLRANKGASYHFVVGADAGTFVGTNRTIYGPFEAIKEATVSNDGSQLSFFAKDEAGWHLHYKGKLSPAYDETRGLSFTQVGDHPRYSVRRGKQWATVIADQLFHKIRYERTNQAVTTHAFAGHQDDGWHLVVNMQRSDAFEGIGQLHFAIDEHGVFADVEKEGQHHLLHLPHGGQFTISDGFDSLGKPSYYSRAVRKGSFSVDEKVLTLTPENKQDKTRDELAKMPAEAALFVVFEHTYRGRQAARWVTQRDGDKFTLNKGWSEATLAAMSKQGSRLVLHDARMAFSYAIKRDGRDGYVYDKKVYTHIHSHRFGATRTLYLIVEDSLQRWITGSAVHGGYKKITFAEFEPDEPPSERYVLKAWDGDKPGYIIGNPSGFETEFGMVDKSDAYKWTPKGGVEPRTLIWGGTDLGKSFKAVGLVRYDGAEDFEITPYLKQLAYVASKNGREGANIGGVQHSWYSDVDGLVFKGLQDTPTYKATNHYQEKADLSIDGKKQRSITRLVVGEKQSAKFHEITLLQSNAALEDTQYLARSDEGWRHYRGNDPLSATFKEIAFRHRWDEAKVEEKEEKESSDALAADAGADAGAIEKEPEPFVADEPRFHFLGRDDQGWVEVHHGQQGLRSRGFATTQAAVTRVGDDDNDDELKMKPKERGNISIQVLPDGEFIYTAKMGKNQVLVHAGRTMVQATTIDGIWSFPNGKVAATLSRGDKKQAMFETSLSPLADKIEKTFILDNKIFVAQLKIGDQFMLWSTVGRSGLFKELSTDPKPVNQGKAWQAVVSGLAKVGDGRGNDTLAAPSDKQALIQGGRVIAVADEMTALKESDAGFVIKIKIKQQTARSTRDVLRIVTLLKAQKDRLNKEPLNALEEVLSVWENYGFIDPDDGYLSDDMDTVSEDNSAKAFDLLKAALDVDFEDIGSKSGGGRKRLDELLKAVRDKLHETLEDRYRILVNGEMGPIFEEIDNESVKVLGSGGLKRTLYIGKRRDKKEVYLASSEELYGPHKSIEEHGWAFEQGGLPYAVTKDGEKNTLWVGEEKQFEGSKVESFIRFGSRVLLSGSRSNQKLLLLDEHKVQGFISQTKFKDQDLFLNAWRLANTYDLWSSKVRMARANTLYTMDLEEDEESGDSTLHWIEGDLNMKAETMRVLQHQMPISRVPCGDLQTVEVLFGTLPSGLAIPNRDEAVLVATVGAIDKNENKRFIVVADDGRSFNFGEGAIAEKEKALRKNRKEWVGKRVDMSWRCSYHKPRKGLDIQRPRPVLVKLSLHKEEDASDAGPEVDENAEAAPDQSKP